MFSLQKQIGIGIVGLGYVGLTLAAHLANRQSKIYGFETNHETVNHLLSGKVTIQEVGLMESIREALDNEKLVINDFQASELDVLFICVGTPKPKLGEDSFQLFYDALVQHTKFLKRGGVLFLRSTVAVGTTRRVEEKLHQLGRGDIAVCFAPERTAEGVALLELETLPQLFGANDTHSGTLGNACLDRLGFRTVRLHSSEQAELAKLICNTWRDTTFAFANEMAMLGDRLKVDAQAAIRAANFDYERSQVPLPGPVSGPCLSKDTYILHENFGAGEYSVTLEARRVNELFEEHVKKLIEGILVSNRDLKRVVVAGLAFKGKPQTFDIRDSLGVSIVSRLREKFPFVETHVWEEQVPSNLLPDDFSLVVNPHELSTFDLLILANNAPFLSSQGIEFAIERNPNMIVVDVWGTLDERFRVSGRYKLVGDGLGL